MNDDVSDIAAYYDAGVAREHSRLDRHLLEFELTWRYLDRYLPPRGRVLEIGAATGRYTIELARRGYHVTAVDLSPELIAACRRNLAHAGLDGRVQLVVADARALGAVAETGFDAALLMGPLYHLIEEDDRRQAVREVGSRLRAGGIIASSFISRYGVLGDLIKETPGWIDDSLEVRSFIERGRRPDTRPRGGFRGYFAQVSELAPLHEAAGFATLVVAGVEPAISADDASYNRLPAPQRARWLDLLYEVSTEPSTIGASRHLLYVGSKRPEPGGS